MDKTFLEKPLLERRIQLPWPQEPSWYSQQPMARCWSKQTQMDHQGISSLNLEWKDLDKNTKTSHFVSGILQCNCRLAWWHIHAPCSLEIGFEFGNQLLCTSSGWRPPPVGVLTVTYVTSCPNIAESTPPSLATIQAWGTTCPWSKPSLVLRPQRIQVHGEAGFPSHGTSASCR